MHLCIYFSRRRVYPNWSLLSSLVPVEEILVTLRYSTVVSLLPLYSGVTPSPLIGRSHSFPSHREMMLNCVLLCYQWQVSAVSDQKDSARPYYLQGTVSDSKCRRSELRASNSTVWFLGIGQVSKDFLQISLTDFHLRYYIAIHHWTIPPLLNLSHKSPQCLSFILPPSQASTASRVEPLLTLALSKDDKETGNSQLTTRRENDNLFDRWADSVEIKHCCLD